MFKVQIQRRKLPHEKGIIAEIFGLKSDWQEESKWMHGRSYNHVITVSFAYSSGFMGLHYAFYAIFQED